jgi:hypothetical protein
MNHVLKSIEETCQIASDILGNQYNSFLSNNNRNCNKYKKRKMSSNNYMDKLDGDFVTSKVLLGLVPHVFKSLINLNILPLPENLMHKYFYQLDNCGDTIDLYSNFWKVLN